MKEYIISSKDFFIRKTYFDGYVFWKEEGENMRIRLVIPSKERRLLLIKLSIEIRIIK